MELLTTGAILLAALSAGPSAAQTPRFGGTWIQDAAKSVLMGASAQHVELTIVEGATNIRVRRQIGTATGAEEFSGTTDGKPNEQRTGGSVYVRTLRREGRDLLWQIRMTRLSDNATITFSERWSVSDDGQTLTVHRMYPNAKEVLQVFARKAATPAKAPRRPGQAGRSEP
jgi:hypothetical protein